LNVRGTIKFVDGKTGQWGFIVREDGGPDVHFSVGDFLVDPPWTDDRGAQVSFEIEGQERQRAVRIVSNLSPGPIQPSKVLGNPGRAFPAWACVPQTPFVHRDGRRYSSVYELLALSALQERWQFGDDGDGSAQAYPILRNYITYTFYRLQSTEGIVTSPQGDEECAAFNTGLVDALYDPIFALFKRNHYLQQPPWRFYDFCIPGKGASGKRLTSIFDPLPNPARYFDNNFEMILDADRDIHVDYEHVIFDGVAGDRFPAEFLAANQPRNFTWEDFTQKSATDRIEFLKRLSAAIEADLRCTRAIKNRLEDAKELAEKRTRWNFKTAIPQYHPRFNVMSLLLPLALVDDEQVDIALVVTKNPSGSYQGRTILPLHWAYQNARIVCRPDSDWLVPNRIRPGGDGIEGDP
jgi:hypothetical protein